MTKRRPRSHEDDDDMSGFLVGSASTRFIDKHRVTTREFPPGFHGANPGPSHEDDPPPPKKRAPRKPKTTSTKPKTRKKT